MRYLIKFSYDGSCFDGYQRQPNKKTIQGQIEKALSSLEQQPITIQSSGRTDKGVHAKEQYAHFELTKNVKLYNLKKYLNDNLSGKIHIIEAEEINEDFHARYNVKSKTYSYYINLGEYNPIARNYIYQYNKPLNIELLKQTTKYLIGKHDFRSFCTNEKEKENCIREIYNIDIELNDDILKITFTGNGFLRKMIRNIIAIMIKISENNEEPQTIKKILKQNKRLGNMKTVPGCGLYLEKINY